MADFLASRPAARALLIFSVACAGCTSVAPIDLAGLNGGAYLTDPARISQALNPDSECVMAQAAFCAYQVEQHANGADGKMDDGFCAPLADARGWQAYGVHANNHRDAAFVARRGDEIVIAFRGTVPPRGSSAATFAADWENDAAFQLFPDRDLDGVEIHKGFHDALASLFPGLTQDLARLLADGSGKVRGIYLTGHSKGGAMAYIAALKLKRLDPTLPIKGVYTFGAPRPGGEAFRNEYEKALGSVGAWRFENLGDLVPHVVPDEGEAASLWQYLRAIGAGKLPIGRYRSIGRLVFMNGDTGVVVQVDPGDHKLAELTKKALGLSGTWSAHSMRTYLAKACRPAAHGR